MSYPTAGDVEFEIEYKVINSMDNDTITYTRYLVTNSLWNPSLNEEGIEINDNKVSSVQFQQEQINNVAELFDESRIDSLKPKVQIYPRSREIIIEDLNLEHYQDNKDLLAPGETISDRTFGDARIENDNRYLQLSSVQWNLCGSTLTNVKFQGQNDKFQNYKLAKSNFMFATLKEVIFQNCDLSQANMMANKDERCQFTPPIVSSMDSLSVRKQN